MITKGGKNMICPKCRSLMYPFGDEYVCKKCGHKVKRENKGTKIISIKRKEKEIPVLEREVDIFPRTEVVCPKCGNTEAYWILKQTRAADEPETKIYTCTKCGYRWRE